MRSKNRRKDALLFLVAWVSILSFLIPLTMLGHPNPSVAFFVCIGVAAIIATLVAALLVAADLWLLLGNASPTSRLLAIVTVHLPLLVMLAGFAYASARIGIGVDRLFIFAIATQRLFVVLLLIVLGETLQRFSHWRMNGPIGSGVARRRMQTSIGDLMILTALVGMALGLCAFWADAISIPRRIGISPYEVSGCLFLIAMGTIVEVMGVILLLLMPALTSYGAPWIHRRYPTSVCLWTILFTVITSPIGFLIGGADHLSLPQVLIAIAIYLSCGIGIGLVLWFMLWFLARQGFSLGTDEEAVEETLAIPGTPASWSPWYRRWMFRICGLTAISIVSFCYFVDVYTLFDSACSFADARRVAWLIREERSLLGMAGGTTFGRQQVRLGTSPTFSLVGDSDKLLRLMRGIPKNASYLGLTIEGKVTAELLDEVSKRTLGSFLLVASDLDEQAFDRCCGKLTAANVDIGVPSGASLESLKKIKGLANVVVKYPVVWDSARQSAIQGLPIDQLAIRLESDDLGDPAGLAGLQALEIHKSRITRETAMKLAPLKLASLTFKGCKLDITAAKELAKAKAEFIEWDELNETVTEDAAFFALVSNAKTRLELKIECDEILAAKLFNLATRWYLSVNGDDSSDISSEHWATFFSEIKAEEAGDETAAIRRIATKFVTDDVGNLVEFDFRGMPLPEIDFGSQQFQTVKKLRIGHPSQSRRTFRQIATLSNLQDLEIASHTVSSRSFREICKLKQLKRLRLPNVLRLRSLVLRKVRGAVMRLPVDVDAGELDVDHLAAIRYGSREIEQPSFPGDGYGGDGYGDEYGEVGGYLDFSSNRYIDHDAFSELVALKELEVLEIPGHLLVPETIGAFEQLPKLKELHAPFSLVDLKLLSRIAKMEQIETLNIGVRSVDKPLLNELAKLPGLKTLQLIVFDENLLGNVAGQNAIKASLQKSLPNCEVHLRFVESFPTVEEMVRYY